MKAKFPLNQDDADSQHRKVKEWARENFTYEQLLHEFAKTTIIASLYKAQVDLYETFDAEKESIENEIQRLQSEQKKIETLNNKKIAVEKFIKGLQTGAQVMATAVKIKAQKQGKSAAEARHSKPGNSRDKQTAIRAAWASGKYSSRDLCAEQECAALNMAPGTARRALRNTPKPA